MGKHQRKSGEPESEVLQELPLACQDETAAVEFLEKQRWGDESYCPHCGSVGNTYQMTDAKTGTRNKRYLWRYRDCKKQFTVRIGTVFEDSRIPLRHWCYAFWAACASKKGVSALQISRQCSVSYKSALFMMHRIRFAMTEPAPAKLTGTVEADETYVGARRQRGMVGRNYQARTPVFGVVQRDGDVRAKVIPDVTGKTLRGALQEYVDLERSRLMTDEWRAYRKVGREFGGGHETVNHRAKEYSRGDVYTNTAESFFALIKRGIYGTFHAVSKKHLHRYVSEFEFRWNTRKLDDGERLAQAIQQSQGKRLMYREPIRKMV